MFGGSKGCPRHGLPGLSLAASLDRSSRQLEDDPSASSHTRHAVAALPCPAPRKPKPNIRPGRRFRHHDRCHPQVPRMVPGGLSTADRFRSIVGL